MSNNRHIDILVGIATGQQERFATVLAEIRGLQTENRRILDRLFGAVLLEE